MSEQYKWPLETLTASDTTAKVIYQPPNGFNAEIIDFFCTVTLVSCNEIPPYTKPEGVELMNQREISIAWNETTTNANKKILVIEFINAEGKKAKSTEFTIMRVTPSYTDYLLTYLTNNKTLIVPNGCKIQASVRAYNCGVLQGADTIDFRLVVKEFKTLDIDELATKYL